MSERVITEIDVIHTFFGLSYANYLVLPRALLQSMPEEWQTCFVALVEELDAAFEHVEKPQAYKVDAAIEREYSSLTEAQLTYLRITVEDADGETYYYDDRGDQHRGWERVLIPVVDPVPHYNRGRTHIEPHGATS